MMKKMKLKVKKESASNPSRNSHRATRDDAVSHLPIRRLQYPCGGRRGLLATRCTLWREAERDSQEELIWTAFKEEMEVSERLERVQKALESAVEDMNLMGRLLDELGKLQNQAQECDLSMVDAKICKLMPEFGFAPDDGDWLVASFRSGWQMRMSLGKILLQHPDLLLLDEPTNHLDLDTIEWLEDYLNQQDVPMVIISHDRAFQDRLCTKIVETDMGVSRTYEGNYSEYYIAKAAWIESQNAAWEKQQKEIEHTKDLINRWALEQILAVRLLLERSWRNFRKKILLKGHSRGNR